MVTSTDRTSRLAASLLALFFGALYLAHAAVGPVVGDGPELTIAAYTLGIPHPSGYPLFTLLSRVSSLWLDPTRALHILNAVFAAVAVGLLTKLLARSTGVWPALLAGIMLGGSATLLREATRFEVYTFWLLLLVLLLLLARSRPLFLFYVAGLACAHHLSILFLAPAILVAAWPAVSEMRRTPIRLLLGLALFAIGISVYACLPVRAALAPTWNWGDPSNLARFTAHVTGRGYWGYAGGGGADDLIAFCLALPREVSWAGLLLVPLGGAALAAKKKWRELAVIALGIGGIAFYIARYGVNDPEPYFLPIVLFLSFLLAAGTAFLTERIDRLRPVLLTTVGALLVWQAGMNARAFDRRDNTLLSGYVTAILQTVDADGALVVEGDAETFGLFHAQIVNRDRTDVTVYNSLFDLGPEGPIFARERNRGPAWKRRALLDALRAGTPIHTAVEQDLFSEPGYVLRQHGLLYRWDREGTPPRDPDLVWSEYDLSFTNTVNRDSEYLERWIAANVWTQSARQAMGAGDLARGGEFLARAEEIAGASAAIYLNAGRAHREYGNVEQALRLYRLAAEHARDGLVAWNEADLLIARDRDIVRADSLLVAVCERDSRLRYSATLRRGRLAIKTGRFADARDLYQEAASLRPADAAPQRGLWESSLLLGDVPGVVRALAELERVAPGSTNEKARDEATFFDKARRYAAADSLYAILLSDTNGDAYDWNAGAWNQALRETLPATALQYIDHALALLPDDPYLLETKGWILYRSGLRDQAALLMDRALNDLSLPGAGPRWRRAIVAHAARDTNGEERWSSEARLWRENQRWRIRYEEEAGGS